MRGRMDLRGVEVLWALLGGDELAAVEQGWRERLSSPRVSGQAVFRSYIEGFSVLPPPEEAWASSLVIAAVAAPGRLLAFDLPEGSFELFFPPNYAEGPLSRAEVAEGLRGELGAATRLEPCWSLPLKHTAAWAGLTRYGRNNIAHAPGMGSALKLMAFRSDAAAPSGGAPLPGPAFLEACADCGACRAACPTGAIPEDGGCLDAGRCLSLYNEIEGDFPDWIPPTAHNAAIGCALCEDCCPENAAFRAARLPLGPYGRAELELLLRGGKDEATDALIGACIASSNPEYLDAYRPVLKRNVAALLEARGLRTPSSR